MKTKKRTERGANLPREDLLAVLRFVHQYRQSHEHSPSTREIQVELKMSAPSMVQRRVDALFRMGWATRDASAYRTLRPTALGLQQLDHRGTTSQETLQALYDSEINFEISTFWDAGFDWKLGDEMNGYPEGGCADTLKKAVDAIAKAAIEHFPNSEFTKAREGAL